ncbi:hypothetical protein ACH5RR_037547 [Cinchona calisaya]|uniref:Uncharacterized protein n=1 Tax=Cinchona calisaya TaxID=153742 RepID=A0ABD2Y6H7_9GENT
MPDTVRIHVRDIHWRDYDYYHTLSSFGTPINFRIWAEQQVYGGITAIHHHQVANHCVQRYYPEPGKRRIDCTVATRTVELELVDPIPGEYRVEAIMGAEIEWSGLLGMANVRIRGRNATGQNFEYYRPLSSFGTTTRFRMWAEQKVYGRFNAVESCQVANINVLQYQPEPGQRWSDCRVPRRTVEEGYVTPLREQHRMLATMYAAIEWRDVTGRWIPFHDYQWLYITSREAIEIFIRPGFHPKVIQILPV